MMAALFYFLQTFPSFIFSSFWQWWFSWGAFFFVCIAHSTECGCVSSGFCAPLFVYSKFVGSYNHHVTSLLIASWIQTVYLMHPSVYSYCIFLFHMFNRTGILNHKAGEFSIFYFLWDSQGESENKRDVTEHCPSSWAVITLIDRLLSANLLKKCFQFNSGCVDPHREHAQDVDYRPYRIHSLLVNTTSFKSYLFYLPFPGLVLRAQ